MAGNSLETRWGLLEPGTPNIEFWHPADTPADIIRIYHGIQHNVPNRRINKTTLRTQSAGNEYNFRNVGYSSELMRVDVVLTTKTEARNFTDFFKYIIKGSSGVFYYRNNSNGQESYVRLMGNQLNMGEAEGAPYSYSLLLKKEAPYSGNRLTLIYTLNQEFNYTFITGGHFGEFSIALKPVNSKTLNTTGQNLGALGTGDLINRNRFEIVGIDTDWSFGAGGVSHAHIVNEVGDLFSSGVNSSGQLGLGDTTQRVTYTQMGGDLWVKVACGVNFSVAIRSDNSLWAWGQNNTGQLGQGSYDTDPHSTPLQIGTDTDWVSIACGGHHTVAIKSDGTLWACGRDDFGQLGQGSTTTRRPTLTKVGIDTDWSFVGAGYEHTVVVKNNGALWACGSNSMGELGDGTTVDKYILTQIGSSMWSRVFAGGGGPSFTHGIKTDGTLWAWGKNNNSELGIGSADANPHSIPLQIGTDTDWRDIHCRLVGGAATKEDNSLWAWGHNSAGDCGLGHNTIVYSPTKTLLTGNSVSLKWNILFDFPPP